MLQYIINSSCIWLLGLIVFDLFLRNEANHTYNRLYLLFILLSGALVPLWSWDYDAFIYATDASRPLVEQTAVVKETVVTASQQTMIGWEQWLTVIYFSGVVLLMILFAKDIVSIILLYKKGTKSKDGTWTIIETGKEQSPFSAFRYVFISGKKNYSDEELQMILAHEEQHGHLLHFIDVLITRISTIVFWFNPMVYLIQRRLLLVHEYQADLAVRNNKSIYGQFLIEQSILGSAPVLAHSFIRSPLKKRLLMMTKKTTTLAKSKQVLIIPVMLLSMLCFTQNAFSWSTPEKKGDKYIYRGNVIEYNSVDSSPDTSEVMDPLTGEIQMVITRRVASPIKINGEPIYNSSSMRTPGKGGGDISSQSSFTGQGLKVYLLTNLNKEIKKLGDGTYKIDVGDIVIGKDGRIVFFQFAGITQILDKPVNGSRMQPIDDDINELFGKKVAKLINTMPPHKPADIGGDPIYSIKDAAYGNFKVKDGKLQSL